jgi:hypothetical protein
MVSATVIAGIFLYTISPNQANALDLVWWATSLWILVRAIFGILRIYPGVGNSPFRA